MNRPELQWGQTPFDECSREELVQHCARLYSATTALSSVAKMVQGNGPYWTRGSGAVALEKGRQALEKARNGFGDESFHCAYLRYAEDLLFADAPGIGIRSGWVVCPVCDQMAAPAVGASPAGRACGEIMPGGCHGTLRELMWSDLSQKPVDA